jgi:putative polyhydroxyalkanoate system protein
MAAIHVTQPYTMSHAELKQGLDELAEKLGEQYQLKCDWQSDECLGIHRSGVNGQLTVGEQEIELTLNLGMLMSAFKGVIEREITTFIDEHIY